MQCVYRYAVFYIYYLPSNFKAFQLVSSLQIHQLKFCVVIHSYKRNLANNTGWTELTMGIINFISQRSQISKKGNLVL
jgi:hypothetical protein